MRTAYDGRRVAVTVRESGVVRTRQSMKDACDINLIMKKYLRGGVVDHLARHGGEFGFATSQTFHEAMNIVCKAEEMFADLSSDLRRRFGNSPAAFLEFVHDRKNVAECRKLGLMKPEVVPEAAKPLEVVVVGAPPAAGAPAPAKPAGTVAT